jgi:hypothetical protein
MPDRRGINVPLSKGLIGCRIRVGVEKKMIST